MGIYNEDQCHSCGYEPPQEIEKLEKEVEELKEIITDQVKIIDEISNHLLDSDKELKKHRTAYYLKGE